MLFYPPSPPRLLKEKYLFHNPIPKGRYQPQLLHRSQLLNNFLSTHPIKLQNATFYSIFLRQIIFPRYLIYKTKKKWIPLPSSDPQGQTFPEILNHHSTHPRIRTFFSPNFNFQLPNSPFFLVPKIITSWHRRESPFLAVFNYRIFRQSTSETRYGFRNGLASLLHKPHYRGS